MPPGLRRWRIVLPEEAGTGAAPRRWAKEASLFRRSGLSPAATSRVAGSASEATLAVSFDASDRDGLRTRALRAAVEDARGIALILAEASGVKIEGVERIDHGNVRFGGGAEREFEGFARRRGSGADPDIEPRAVDAEVEVSIAYRIS